MTIIVGQGGVVVLGWRDRYRRKCLQVKVVPSGGHGVSSPTRVLNELAVVANSVVQH
jgi:hypothetical protein